MAARKDVAIIKQVLAKGLNHLKKPPKIAVRKSGVGDNLYVYVLSDSFSRLSLTKRHELVEDILQRSLDPETLLRISALFVLTTKEADGFFPNKLEKTSP
jgi:stress-induced morphogen